MRFYCVRTDVENLMRLGGAAGIFLLMMGAEYFMPRRKLCLSRLQRWRVNLGLAALNMLIMRLTLGSMAYLAALTAQHHHWGLLQQLSLAQGQNTAISLLLLDFSIYLQHILAHRYSPLWRLHQVHHSDIEIDLTTAVRFHPLEILFSMLYKTLWIFALGATPQAIVLFEILLNGLATFNHSNFFIPPFIDKQLRRLIVTPDMHRIHHSVIPREMNSNYGFCLSLWDKLFKTYCAAPSLSHTTLQCGLTAFRQAEKLTCNTLLILPFSPKKQD